MPDSTISVENLLQFTSRGAGNTHLDPLAYRIKEIELFPVGATFDGRDSYNLIPQAQAFVITEGIDQNSVHVNFHIIDAVGFLETLRIQGGEKISIHVEQKIRTGNFVTPGTGFQQKTKTIKLDVYISDIKEFEKVNMDTQKFLIECVSKPAYINQLTILNSSFSGGPGTEIKKIAEGVLGIDEEFTEEFNTEIGPAIKGIYPKMRPFAAINWLLRNSSSDGTPVFFYESLKDGYQLQSWEDFLDNEVHDEYNNFPYPFNIGDQKGGRITRESPEYYDAIRRVIIKIKSFLGISRYNDAKKGAYASSLTSVDVSTKTYKTDSNVFKYESLKTLNEFKPFSTKVKFNQDSFNTNANKNARNFFISENSNAFSGSTNNYHSIAKEVIQKKEAYLANIHGMIHEITLPGDPDLTVGSKIELKIWKIQEFQNPDNAEGRKKGDQFMGGKYIIKKINHYFTNEGYSMNLEIIKDSSLIDFDEEFKVK